MPFESVQLKTLKIICLLKSGDNCQRKSLNRVQKGIQRMQTSNLLSFKDLPSQVQTKPD
jgi:hypothetical protein